MIDLHIIQNEKTAVAAVASHRKLFKAENNPYVIFGGGYHYSFDDFENVTVIEENGKGSRQLTAMMKSADRIHVHGLFSFRLLGILATHKKICRKTVWYMWGDDLYCLKKPKSTLKNRLHLALRKRAYKNVRYVATNVVGDYKLLCSLMHKDYEFFELRFGPSYVDGIRPFADRSDGHEGVNILIGNSATASNFHIQILEKLLPFRDENVRIFAPLSYGSKAYAETVIAKGKELFGDKFVPLTEFMPKEQYFGMLTTMDVAIFANNRQQAMGNIVALLYAGKKVYIRSDISSWESLHDEYKIGVHDYKDLDNENFSSFAGNMPDPLEQRRLAAEMTDEKKHYEAMRRTLISEV